jgi:hypothetical protein
MSEARELRGAARRHAEKAQRQERDDKPERSRKAVLIKDIATRTKVAETLASLFANHPNNKSDPFAYGRAHAAVMNGIYDQRDFEDAVPKFCPSL